jgi:hypothetical protein
MNPGQFYWTKPPQKYNWGVLKIQTKPENGFLVARITDSAMQMPRHSLQNIKIEFKFSVKATSKTKSLRPIWCPALHR